MPEEPLNTRILRMTKAEVRELLAGNLSPDIKRAAERRLHQVVGEEEAAKSKREEERHQEKIRVDKQRNIVSWLSPIVSLLALAVAFAAYFRP